MNLQTFFLPMYVIIFYHKYNLYMNHLPCGTIVLLLIRSLKFHEVLVLVMDKLLISFLVFIMVRKGLKIVY